MQDASARGFFLSAQFAGRKLDNLNMLRTIRLRFVLECDCDPAFYAVFVRRNVRSWVRVSGVDSAMLAPETELFLRSLNRRRTPVRTATWGNRSRSSKHFFERHL